MVHLSGSTKTTQGGDSAPFLLVKTTQGEYCSTKTTQWKMVHLSCSTKTTKTTQEGDGTPFLLYKNYAR